MTPSSGTIGAGTPIDVSFTESAPAGALITMVRTTGPCVAEWGWSENFATSLNRTVPVTLGYPCELGVPIGIDVVTYDAMGNSVTGGKSTTVTMTDTLRPTTQAIFWHRGGLDMVSPYAQWAAGDTLWIEVHVQDDYKVEGLFLEVYPFGVADSVVVRDSIVDADGDFVQPRSAIQRFPVVLRPEWAGSALQFRYYGRDSEGHLSNVFTTDAGCVTITAPSPSLSPSAMRARATSRLGAAGSACAYTPGDPVSSLSPLASRGATRAVNLKTSRSGSAIVASAYSAMAIR